MLLKRNATQRTSLNRITSKSYSVPSGSSTAATAAVVYNYDQGGFRGALSSVCSQSCTAGSGTIIDSYTYDAFGRTTASAAAFGTNYALLFQYQYSLTDQLTQVIYPSGRTVQYALDAADRVQTVKNVGTNSNYASLNYTTSPGNTLTLTLGNSVTEQPSFNDRLQPTGLQATSPTAGSLLTLGLYPCASQATSCSGGDVGNLQAQTITIPNFSVTQTYGYDTLNRLTSATESGSGWSQSYSYVGNGNRWVSNNSGSPTLPLTPETPTASSAYTASSVPNRINTWSYDSNGNILSIPMAANQSRNFAYDAENRTVGATIVTGTGNLTASYVYDGLGQRVSKTVNGLTTTYVYDAFGNLMAEYGDSNPSPCGTATC